MLIPLLIGGAALLALMFASSSSASSAVLHQGAQPAKPKPLPGSDVARQRGAARALAAYLKSTGDFGSKSKPSPKVRSLQSQMGKIAADGIVGPATSRRAAELGYALPSRGATLTATPLPPGSTADDERALERFMYGSSSSSSAPPAPSPAPVNVPIATRQATLIPGTKYRATLKLSGAQTLANNDQVIYKINEAVGPWKGAKATGVDANRVATGTYVGAKRAVTLPAEVVKLEILAPSPAPISNVTIGPATITGKGTPAQQAAARALNALLRQPGADFGSKAKPAPKVRELQKQMGNLTADGIVGPATTWRASELGQTLPPRPSSSPSPRPSSSPSTRPLLTAPLAFPKPAAAVPAASVKPPSTATAPAAADSSARAAARALDAYLSSNGRDRNRIADLQWQLGLDADGIPGAGTRAAVKLELGAGAGAWRDVPPAQLTGGVPGGSSKREAAERLERYWNVPGSSHNAQRVAAYQRVLGVAADGKVGPQTRTAASSALGRPAKL
jgi:peptidoglycan hydrolase-like protein with peptidoglycan-binding domain